MKLYSVYDETAKEFAQPFVAVNDDVAIRNFRYSCSRLSEFIVADLVLWLIGEFNEVDGSLVKGSKPIFAGALLNNQVEKEVIEDGKEE